MSKKTFDASTVLKYSPQKTRLIINVIRGMSLRAAMDQLTVMKKGQTRQLYNLLKNAATSLNILESDYARYTIKEIIAEDAQKLKRIMPRARGSASPILRRYSRVKVNIESL